MHHCYHTVQSQKTPWVVYFKALPKRKGCWGGFTCMSCARVTDRKSQAKDTQQEQSFQIHYFILHWLLSTIRFPYYHELSSNHCLLPLLSHPAAGNRSLCALLPPSREALHRYPQGALIFLLQSSPPDTDYGAYKHSIASSASPFSLTF